MACCRHKHATPADRAAMCAACVRSVRTTDAGGELWSCTVSGRPLADHIVRRARCPAGRHPACKTGVLRWLGVSWYGVPYPVRIWLWVCHARHPRPSRFTGCGCFVWAKNLWVSIKDSFTTAACRRRLSPSTRS